MMISLTYARRALPAAIAWSLFSCAPSAVSSLPPDLAAAEAGHQVGMTTPLEEARYQRLTSHEELVAFVDDLADASDLLTRHSLGTSLEDRDIPYLKIGNGDFGSDEGKLRVLIFAQQHGNEPSGKEAALVLARDFADGNRTEVLEALDILLVPSVNPDGAEVHQRRNAADVDLNRSHLILNGHEAKALRELFHRWEPEVTLDVHEYQPWRQSWHEHGYVRLFEAMYGLPTNLNVLADLRRLGTEEFLPYVDRHITERGFTQHEYLVGDPEYIRYSTSNVNDGRQGFAILGTLSMILEGKNGRTETDDIERRTAAQVVALEGLLHFAAERAGDIRSTVSRAREDLREGRVRQLVLVMDRERGEGPLTIPAMGVQEDDDGDRYVETDTVTAEIQGYYPGVTAERTTAVPQAYLVPADRESVIDVMRAHRVEMQELEPGRILAVERVRIEGFEEVERKGGVATQPVVSTDETTYETRSGDMLIPTAQLHGVMVATALEPESMHSLHGYAEFGDLRSEGDYPVLRVIGDQEVATP